MRKRKTKLKLPDPCDQGRPKPSKIAAIAHEQMELLCPGLTVDRLLTHPDRAMKVANATIELVRSIAGREGEIPRVDQVLQYLQNARKRGLLPAGRRQPRRKAS